MELVLKTCVLIEKTEEKCDSSPPQPLLIPIQLERYISECLQLLVVTGLLPYLLPRVGVPIQKRSKFYQLSEMASNRLSEEEVTF